MVEERRETMGWERITVADCSVTGSTLALLHTWIEPRRLMLVKVSPLSCAPVRQMIASCVHLRAIIPHSGDEVGVVLGAVGVLLLHGRPVKRASVTGKLRGLRMVVTACVTCAGSRRGPV